MVIPEHFESVAPLSAGPSLPALTPNEDPIVAVPEAASSGEKQREQ